MRAIGLNVNGTNGINEYAQRITADRMWWGDRYWEPGSFKKALTCLLIMHWNDTPDTLILYLILCRYCVWHSKIQSETQLVRKTDIFNTMKTDCSDPTSYGFMKFSSEKKKWDLGVGSYGEVLTPHRNVFHYSLTKKHRLSLIGHSLDQVRQHYQPCGLLPLCLQWSDKTCPFRIE